VHYSPLSTCIAFGSDDLVIEDNANQTEASISSLTECYLNKNDEEESEALHGISLGGGSSNHFKLKKF